MIPFLQCGSRTAHRLAISIVLVLLASSLSNAQIFHIQGGSSSLVHAHGASVGFQAPGYEGAIGAGMLNGKARFGAVVRTEVLDYKVTAGDDTLRFTLPTDIFNESQYFFGRGLGIAQQKGKTKWSVFGGATSTIVGAPFFQAAKNDTPFGLFFMERQLSPRFKFFSRNIVSRKQTLINGAEYEATPWLKMGVSAGIGGNAGYNAVALVADRTRYTIKASYINADRNFRRVSLEHPLNSEVTKENLSFDFHPNSSFGFSVSRQHFLAPLESTLPVSPEALVNQASVTTAWRQLRTNSSLYLSEADGQRSLGYLIDASRPISRELEVGFTFNRNQPEIGNAMQSYGGRIREILNRHLSMTQYITRSAGQTAIHFGGDFNSSRFSLSISHAVTYAPFRPSTVGSPFVNVYNVSLRFRLFQQLEFNAQSNVAPDGRVRYTTSMSNYMYRYAGLMPGQVVGAASIGKYVVKGIITDEHNNPIAGAAVRVSGELAFTDSEGRFLVRLSKRGRQTLQVSFEDFLTPTIYELVSAASQVEAALEPDAQDVMVVLRRVTNREKLNEIRLQLLAKQGGTKAPAGNASPEPPASTYSETPETGSTTPPAGTGSPLQQ